MSRGAETQADVCKLLSRLKSKNELTPDHFEHLGFIGEGSFGQVRQVRFNFRDRSSIFALKSMNKQSILSRNQLQHVKNEKKILSEIDHPFLLKLITTLQCSEKVYLVLEFVAGGELLSRLRSEGRFSEDITLFYASEILLGLRNLHINDIIYRDLKPENVLIDARGHIKLADFGLSKHVPEDRTFTLCGTQDYFAPEILMNGGKGYGKSADWWAFGVLMYEMLTGMNPFWDKDPMVVFNRIIGMKYCMPKHLSASVKNLLAGLLTRADERLGVADNGEAVMQHDFFRGVCFEQVLLKRVAAPWVPDVNAAEEGTYFGMKKHESGNGCYGGLQGAEGVKLRPEMDALFIDF